jgi:hypothetical protein
LCVLAAVAKHLEASAKNHSKMPNKCLNHRSFS